MSLDVLDEYLRLKRYFDVLEVCASLKDRSQPIEHQIKVAEARAIANFAMGFENSLSDSEEVVALVDQANGSAEQKIAYLPHLFRTNKTDALSRATDLFPTLKVRPNLYRDFDYIWVANERPQDFEHLLAKHALDSLSVYSEGKMTLKEFLGHMSKDWQKPQEPIFHVSLPKSAGPALKGSIYGKIGVQKVMAEAGWFCFSDVLIDPWFQDFAKGHSIATGAHVPATQSNKEIMLASGLTKAVVQVRDPRQAILSLLHHFRLYLQGKRESLRASYLPATYFSMNFEGQLTWLVEHIYPKLVDWIVEWVTFAEQSKGSIEIHFITFEEFTQDFVTTMERYAEFYQLPSGILRDVTLTKSADRRGGHFRKGQIDEWKEVMPEPLQTKCNALLPDYIIEKFGWPKSQHDTTLEIAV